MLNRSSLWSFGALYSVHFLNAENHFRSILTKRQCQWHRDQSTGSIKWIFKPSCIHAKLKHSKICIRLWSIVSLAEKWFPHAAIKLTQCVYECIHATIIVITFLCFCFGSALLERYNSQFLLLIGELDWSIKTIIITTAGFHLQRCEQSAACNHCNI